MLTMTEVQRSRIRAIAAHLWQTKEEFDILNSCNCIIGHAIRMPEMNVAGFEKKKNAFMTIDGEPMGWIEVAHWLGLKPNYFAIAAPITITWAQDYRGFLQCTKRLDAAASREPWFHCQHDAKGAALMLLAAIGDVGPPEPQRTTRSIPTPVAAELEVA